VVLGVDGTVAMVNQGAVTLLGLSPRDVGRPFRDLDLSYRPVELRGHIDRALQERHSVVLPEVRHAPVGAEPLHLRVRVDPLPGDGSDPLGVALVFEDVTGVYRLRRDLDHANRRWETAHEELQSTNEELETTNEELQSSVEELETTNHELQATNEELATSNEELRTVNAELEGSNAELRERTAELGRSRAVLAAVLAGVPAGVAVVDQGLRVRVWNRWAEQMWALPAQQVLGEHLLSLDIGLPADPLRPLLRTLLGATGPVGPVTVDAVDGSGRALRLRVRGVGLSGSPGEPAAVLIMERDGGPQDPTLTPPRP